MQILSTGLVLTRELGKPIVLEQEGSKMTASIQGEKEVEVRGLTVFDLPGVIRTREKGKGQ